MSLWSKKNLIPVLAIFSIITAFSILSWRIYITSTRSWANYEKLVKAGAFDEIRERMKNATPKEQVKAIEALSESKDKRAHDILIESTHSEYPLIRYVLLSRLRYMQPEWQYEILNLLRNDPDSGISNSAKNWKP